MRDHPAWTWIARTVVVLGAFLLLSYGGAIVAAPATLPIAAFVVRRDSSRSWAVASSVVLVLTTAELGWALAYLLLGERQPFIWLIPLVAAIGTVVLVVGWSRLPDPQNSNKRSGLL